MIMTTSSPMPASIASTSSPVSVDAPLDGVFTRADYMDERCTHEQFYGQFVTGSVLHLVRSAIGEDAIVASTNPHFNDIPLKQWDNLHEMVLGIIKSERGKLACRIDPIAGKPGSFHWSLSNSGCTLKEAARQIRDQALEAQALHEIAGETPASAPGGPRPGV